MQIEEWHVWLIVGCTMLVPLIYLLQFHRRLLVKGAGARATGWLFALAALLGVVFSASHEFDRASLGIAVALASPAVHRAVFRVLFRWFVRRYGREPVVDRDDWTARFEDGVFAVAVLFGCIGGTLGVVAYAHLGMPKPF